VEVDGAKNQVTGAEEADLASSGSAVRMVLVHTADNNAHTAGFRKRDAHRPGRSDYGSEGWGFESSRAHDCGNTFRPRRHPDDRRDDGDQRLSERRHPKLPGHLPDGTVVSKMRSTP
jgi:hypothetical protein